MTDQRMLPLVETRDLSVTLGGQTILDQVSFDLAPDTTHALIGPNGAGKTTVLRSLMGSMPHRGRITCHFRGNGRIGYVPQVLEFDRSLPISVTDFITLAVTRRPLFSGVRTSVRRQVMDALERMECRHLASRPIGGLSGGELRRVLLAQALTPLPELLLLDEPASNVDRHGSQLLESHLSMVCKEQGVTILMVAHDLGSVQRIADRVTALNRSVTFDGDPRQIEAPGMLDLLFGTADRAAGQAENNKGANS